jgi:hypothetical protein
MSRDDLLLFLSLAKRVLEAQEMQIAIVKLFSERCDGLQSLLKSYDQLHQLNDAEKARHFRAELERIEHEGDTRITEMQLPDVLARVESSHEKLETMIAALRASLQPPPE